MPVTLLFDKAVMRANLSSTVAGNEGLFNLGLVGNGAVCLESACPKEELVEITLQDDVLKIDGNMAIAWSGSLDFTVERSGKSLIGSAASGGRSCKCVPWHRKGSACTGRKLNNDTNEKGRLSSCIKFPVFP